MSGIFDAIGGLLGGLLGGGQAYTPPPPPDPVQAPAVKVTGGAKSKRMSMANRRRMAGSGQSSLISGGSYGGSSLTSGIGSMGGTGSLQKKTSLLST